MNKSGNIEHESFVVLSDYTKHSASSVYCGYQKLNGYLDEHFPDRKFTYVQSDGCAKEFKSYKSFANLRMHEQDFHNPAMHLFSTTGHGKELFTIIACAVIKVSVLPFQILILS